jgi:hypothetical protein
MARKDSTTGTGKRPTQGTSAYSLVDVPSAKEFAAGSLVAKTGNIKGGTAPAATASKRMATSQERLGPRFSVGVKMPGPLAPEASLTQQNTRFMKSAVNRSQPNFNLGMMG